MRCEDAQAHLPDHLAGTLPSSAAEQVDEHLRICPACAADFDAADDTWQRLAALPSPRGDTRAMRARFDAMLHEHQYGESLASHSHVGLRAYALQGLAAAALVIIGVAVGRQTAAVPSLPPQDPQMAELRDELRQMRHMVTLSLLQQQSASERLKGVTYTSQIEQPDTDITGALLETLRYDPNVNVRLASIDALKRFADDDSVRRGAVATLSEQTSPLVQIALIDFAVEMNDRTAVETLRQLAVDPMTDQAVRTRAAQGVEQLG
jgi:hypothetical protein